jgi:hypothetical protein
MSFHLKIESYVGKIISINELKLDQSEKKYPEYCLKNLSASTLEEAIVIICRRRFQDFCSRCRRKGVIELSDSLPNHREFSKLLPMSGINNLTDEILARPTFFQHFDGVVLDWKFLNRSEKKTLEKDRVWPNLQKLQIWVDLSSGINLFLI